MLLIEVVGWAGGLTILVAYALLNSGRMTADSPLFQFLNVFGALGLVANGVANHAFPSVAVNSVWAVIASVALWRMARPKKSSTSAK